MAEDTSLKVVKYARSPIMSTYLLAFVVGEFDFVEGQDADGVTIRVYTPQGKAVQGEFALEVSIMYLLTKWESWMEKYLAQGHGIWNKRSKVCAP